MIVIGLTGSIGMGKSTCGKLFTKAGIPVHESDHAVHDLLANDLDTQRAVIDAFPSLSLPLDRQALGALIFGHDKNRKTLEAILHPRVQQSQSNFIAQQSDAGHAIIVLDIPLLFETGAEKRCDYTVVASAPYDIQKARVLARPQMSEDKFQAILARQMPDAEKQKRADFIIPTGGDIAETQAIIDTILNQIKQEHTC